MMAIEYTAYDPTRVFDTLRLKRVKPKPRPIPKELEERLVKSLRYSSLHETRASLVVLLGLYEGFRIGEIAGLTWKGVDFEKDEITILGKGALTRTLPLHPAVRTALWICLGRSTDMFGKTNGEHVFRAENKMDTCPNRNTLWVWFKEVKGWAGLQAEDFTTHSLRHTFATTLARNGVSPYRIMNLLGHSSIQMTLQYVETLSSDSAVDYRRIYGV